MALLLALPFINVSKPSILNVRFGPTLSLKYVIPPASETGSALISLSENETSLLIEDLVFPSQNSTFLKKITASGLSWIQIINFIGILWGIGTILFLFRLLYGALSLKKLKKGLIPVDNPKIKNILLESKRVFPRSIQTHIYESTLVRSPLVLGFFKPFILLPSVLLKKMHQNDMKSVLIHELSHIYHRDQKIGVLQRFITALNWWNPLVYILSATLSRAREEISDNHVLIRNNSKEYAECLVNLAEDKSFLGRFTIANAMASSHIPLKERVKFILSKERNMETRLKKSTVCLFVFVSCVFLALITSYRMTFALDQGTNSSVSVLEQEEQSEEEQAVRARRDIKPPNSIKAVKPDYPEKAKKEGMEGVVAGGVEGAVVGGIQGELEQEVLILEEKDRPKLINRVDPIYPEIAKKNGISGDVIVQVTIDIYGRVEEVKILKSIPELDDAAVEALKQWVYEPHLVDGKPVKVAFKVSIHFRLK